MNKLKYLSIVVIAAVSLVSCSKESRIEKNLWKKGGTWKVESLEINQTSSNSADNYQETITNYGTFKFSENGSGSYTITVDSNEENGTFTYSNTESSLNLIINGSVRNFDIVEWEKNNLRISITENYTSNGDNISYTETLSLVKTE